MRRGVYGHHAGSGAEFDVVRLIPVGGLDVPALEILFRPQVCLGQWGTAERDTRFLADDHDRPAETLVAESCRGDVVYANQAVVATGTGEGDVRSVG